MSPRLTRLTVPLLAAVLLLGGLGVAGISAQSQAGAATRTPPVLPTGRLVTPAGTVYDAQRRAGDAAYDLGDFPVGLAVSPDNTLAVASLNGFGQGVSLGFNSTCQADTAGAGGLCPGVPGSRKGLLRNAAPDEGLDVVDLRTGRVRQVVAVPTSHDIKRPRDCGTTINCFGIGVAFSPDGRHVYATGAGTDRVYDFAVANGTLTLAHTVVVPSAIEQLPAAPVAGKTYGNPRGLAVTPDGRVLVIASEFDSTVSLYDLTSGTPTLVASGLLAGGASAPAPLASLYAVAVSPDSAWAYVTAQGTGVVYAVNLAQLRASGATTGLAAAGAPAPVTALSAAVVPAAVVVPGLDHPTGLAVSPDGATLAVAGANSDDVAFLPLTGGVPHLPAVTVALTAADHAGRLGSVPDAVAFNRDGSRAYVALAGDDAVAVVDVAAGRQLGTVPTGWYPTAVVVGPRDGRVYAVSAKGYGSRYVPALGYAPRPGTGLPGGGAIPSADYYDGDNMAGLLTRFAAPDGNRLARYTAQARADITYATSLDRRPADSPIPAAAGDPSPITHVVYVVRENRTYDQVLGDTRLRRKDSDGDPSLAVLAPAVPNAHRIASRFATADHFFSDGEASVQGHWWTSSADSSDYMEKSWRQYYSPRHRPYDPIGPVVTPPGCSIFQSLQAYQATHPSFTFKNYGELVGAADANANLGTPTTTTCGGGVGANPGSVPSDPNYPNQTSLVPDDRTRAAEFLKDSGLTLQGTSAGNGNALRNFNYLILSEDHTTGLSGVQTPRSQVAQNDQALGQIVSALSKSSYWASTMVVAVEDDSQDGFDHVDGHRNVLLLASPWSKHISGDGCAPGYIGHAHYDQASVLRTVELVLGVGPLSAFDASAPPLYDLFQPTSQLSRLTRGSLAPYEVAPAPPFVDEKVASLPRSSSTRSLLRLSRSLDFDRIDRAGRANEVVLWRSLTRRPFPAELTGHHPSNGEVPSDAHAVTLSTRTGAPTTAGSCGAKPKPKPRPVRHRRLPRTGELPGALLIVAAAAARRVRRVRQARRSG